MVEQAGNALKHYRRSVTAAAAALNTPTITEPVSIAILFHFTRPKSHYTSTGKLKAAAPRNVYPARRGDIDKLCRSTLDAITGPLIKDDAQVINLMAAVVWSMFDGVTIELEQSRNTIEPGEYVV